MTPSASLSAPRRATLVPLALVTVLVTAARADAQAPRPDPRAPAESRDAGRTGAIVGSVRYAGPPPRAEAVDMSAEPYCAELHDGRPTVAGPVRVDSAGGLAGVVVHIREGLPPATAAARREPALLDQRGCVYAPRVVALQVDQPLIIRNSDEVLHNVHVTPQHNREFNVGQPLKGIEVQRTFASPEVGIRVRCDVHGWMTAWIAVFEHPHFAVTGPDGRFSLDGLPAGEYVVEAWHETLGTRTARVRVEEGGAAELELTFGAAGT